MRLWGLAMALAVCCLLGGCSLLNRSYSTVEPHSNKFWESEAEDTLRAENHQDVVNDLMILVGSHRESAILRLYGFGDDMAVADTMDAAASEVQQQTPLGSYAVDYITSTSQALRGYYEVSVSIRYRRTEEQLQSIVNATSIAALRELLTAAMEGDRKELAVRVGYFRDQQAEVEQVVSALREERGLQDTPPWAVLYYPQSGQVGLIEFIWDGQELPEETDGAGDALAEETLPTDTAQPAVNG